MFEEGAIVRVRPQLGVIACQSRGGRISKDEKNREEDNPHVDLEATAAAESDEISGILKWAPTLTFKAWSDKLTSV